MGDPLIIHLSRARFVRIKSFGWTVAIDVPCDYRRDGDTIFHLMDSEREWCDDCGEEFSSVNANDPAELDAIKYQLQAA